MRFWMIFWLVIAALVAVFSILNWGEFTRTTELSLIVATVSAPLGLVMLGAMAALSLLYLIFLVWLETKALVQFGRKPAAATEPVGTVVADLRQDLERHFAGLRTEMADSLRGLTSRLDHLERTMKDEFGRAG